MKRFKKILFLALMVAALSCLFCQPAFAISEEEVQAQVDAVGKEAVSGNVLIWFMCAIGFLKVSQKIDSFMASLGVNVGHTGGSMLAEAMIAAKGIGGFKNFSAITLAADAAATLPMSMPMAEVGKAAPPDSAQALPAAVWPA